MTDASQTRIALKVELLQHIERLSVEQALLPVPNEFLDQIVQQLEAVTPIPYPLRSSQLSALLGNWRLVYASNGTVVTRQLTSPSNKLLMRVEITQVWQRFAADNLDRIAAENGAELKLPWLGVWQLKADGIWKFKDEQATNVSFHAFSIQAVAPFGQPNWSLPALRIPVLEMLRNEAVWITSYLDEDLRIGRGVTGNLFVFCRQD